MKKLVAAALAVVGAQVCAWADFDESVTVWRGETTSLILHDHVAVGDAPAGVAFKTGVAEAVRYLDRPFGTHYHFAADRVVWGGTGVGPRVLSVSAAADAQPGTYRCGDVTLKVLDRVLPPAKDWKFFLDLWQHPWAVARYFGLEPFSPAHEAAMRPLWEMLAGAGQKALTVTILDRPWNHQCRDAYRSMVRHVKCADGSWKFDYRILDRYVEFGRSCGIGPQIACYTMCPWEYQVAWEDEAGNPHAVKAIPGTPAFEEYWGAFLTDFERHAKEKGWLGDLYIAMDERSPEDVMNIVKFVNAKAPGLKIALAGNRAPSAFKGIEIQNCCFGLRHLTDELIAEAADRRKRGFLTTFYVCCGPNYPNTFMSSELDEAFWLGAYPAMSGLDGFLRWAWNSWPQDPMVDASYTGIKSGWKSGDTFLVYPDGSPSLRFLSLKNGIQTAEKIRILRESGELPDAFASLASRYDRKKAMDNACNFTALKNDTLKLVNTVPEKVSVFHYVIENIVKERKVSFEKAGEMLRKAGVTGFDTSYDYKGMENILKTGLKPVNLYGKVHFLAADQGAAEADAFLAAAVKYGAKVVMIIPEDFPGKEDQETEFAKMLPGLRAMVAKAVAAGITPTMEDFGAAIRNPCSYAKYLARFIDEVPGLQLALDSGNLSYANRGDDILELQRHCAGRLAHVHLKDFARPGPNRDYVTIGTGVIPNQEIVRRAKASGYRGWYTLEHTAGDDTYADVVRQVGRVNAW